MSSSLSKTFGTHSVREESLEKIPRLGKRKGIEDEAMEDEAARTYCWWKRQELIEVVANLKNPNKMMSINS